MVRSTFTYKSIKIKERFPVLLKKYSRLRQKIVTFNPLLHFQNCKLGDPSGGPPDAENRRFSELSKRPAGWTK